jgi:hypothetical protein
LPAIEMIGYGSGIGLHSVHPHRWRADHSGSAREQPKKTLEHTAAGDFHPLIGLKNLCFGKAQADPPGSRKRHSPRVSLTFGGYRDLTPPNHRKDVLFDPPPGPGDRRSTPDSAMRPRAQKCLEWRPGGEGHINELSSAAKAADPVSQGSSRLSREAAAYWIPRFRGYEGNKLDEGQRNCSTICRKSLVAFLIG